MEAVIDASHLIDWAVATRALTGQSVSGDQYTVQPFPTGVLVAVVDGLGHGEEAVTAANLAIAALREHAHESVALLLQRCHDQLKGTRGVVMSLASFSAPDSSMTWVGVGDVEGVLLRAAPSARPARESIPLRGGVLGYQLPPVRAATVSVAQGDLLIFATDGIRSSFVQEPLLNNPLTRQTADGPQELANRLLVSYGKETDDALVLVARYRGETP
jgi:negative regulator of sigma-B (phosphoserine phosphatase)